MIDENKVIPRLQALMEQVLSRVRDEQDSFDRINNTAMVFAGKVAKEAITIVREEAAREELDALYEKVSTH